MEQPQAEIIVKQSGRSSQRIETAKRVVEVRTYALTFQNPGAPLDAIVWTDEAGRLVRFEVPAQSLLVVRDDFASVSSAKTAPFTTTAAFTSCRSSPRAAAAGRE